MRSQGNRVYWTYDIWEVVEEVEVANKRTHKQRRTIRANPYIQWVQGDKALRDALANPLPSERLINSQESKKLLRDILSY